MYAKQAKAEEEAAKAAAERSKEIQGDEEAFLREQDRIGEENKKKEKERLQQKREFWKDYATDVLGLMSGLFSNISSLIGALGQQTQNALEEQYAGQLDSLRELSKEEQALKDFQRQEEINRLKASTDKEDQLRLAATLAEEKRLKELAKVEEELEMKKKQAAYDTALTQWQLSLAGGVASGIQSVLTTLSSAPWPFNIPLAAGAAAAAGIQVAALNAAKPVKNFATGGSYVTNGPESILVGDNPGGQERVTVEPISSPNVSGPNGNMMNGGDVYLDGEKVGRWISNASRDGNIEFYEGSIVA